MVKLKNVRTSTSPPSGRAKPAARKRSASKPAGSGGLVIGVCGWVVAVGLGLAVGVFAKRCGYGFDSGWAAVIDLY